MLAPESVWVPAPDLVKEKLLSFAVESPSLPSKVVEPDATLSANDEATAAPPTMTPEPLSAASVWLLPPNCSFDVVVESTSAVAVGSRLSPSASTIADVPVTVVVPE